MAKQGYAVESRTGHERDDEARPSDEADDPFEEWERYPATAAEETVEYQKVAWYAAPFGDAGLALLVLSAAVNVMRRAGRALIRALMR